MMNFLAEITRFATAEPIWSSIYLASGLGLYLISLGMRDRVYTFYQYHEVEKADIPVWILATAGIVFGLFGNVIVTISHIDPHGLWLEFRWWITPLITLLGATWGELAYKICKSRDWGVPRIANWVKRTAHRLKEWEKLKNQQEEQRAQQEKQRLIEQRLAYEREPAQIMARCQRGIDRARTHLQPDADNVEMFNADADDLMVKVRRLLDILILIDANVNRPIQDMVKEAIEVADRPFADSSLPSVAGPMIAELTKRYENVAELRTKIHGMLEVALLGCDEFWMTTLERHAQSKTDLLESMIPQLTTLRGTVGRNGYVLPESSTEEESALDARLRDAEPISQDAHNNVKVKTP
jgi:hypothetical protein